MGKATRFMESDIRASGRTSRGVRGVSLAAGDRLIAMEVLRHGDTLLAATEYGYGKRTSVDEYPLHRRGGKGVIGIKANERNGLVVALLLVDESEDLMLVTNGGKLIRIPISSISVISRNTQGVKLIEMDEDEILVGAATLVEDDSNGNGENGDVSSVDSDTVFGDTDVDDSDAGDAEDVED
jgi:DNA gyrase subunit A